MNWDAIGAVGEIIGALAVVLTLGYLAVQVRLTNRIANAESYGRLIDAHVGHHRTLSVNPALVEAFARGLVDYEALSPRDQGLFHYVMGPIVLEFQKYLYLHRQGLVPEELFTMLEYDVVASLITPGGKQWWAVSKGKWAEVSEYLDSRMIELEGTVTPSHLDFGGWIQRRGTEIS